MKQKQRRSRHPQAEGRDAQPFHKFSHENLTEMAANIEKGIRDLPVWKDLVMRVGLKEARKLLRQGMFINCVTDGNPKN